MVLAQELKICLLLSLYCDGESVRENVGKNAGDSVGKILDLVIGNDTKVNCLTHITQ